MTDPYRIDARFGRTRLRGRRSKWLGRLALLSFALGLVIVTSWDLLTGPLLAYGDLTAYPSDSSIFLTRFHEAWLERGLGSASSSSPAYLVSALLIETFGGSSTLAQHAYITAWIPVAFLGMVGFARQWLRASWTVAVLTACVYVTTPIAIGLQIAGAVGLIWSYAILPLVIYSAECVKQEGARESPRLILSLACFAVFSPELILLAVFICLIWMLVGSEPSRWRPGFGVALIVAWVCILPAFLGRLNSELLSERLLNKAIADAEYTYASVTPWSIARLAGNRGDPMDALGYNGEQLWTLPGYLLLSVFVYGLVAGGTKAPIIKRIGALFAFGMLSLLTYALVARFHPEIFENVPAILLFRNPEKFSLVLAVALCAGLAYGLSVFERRLRVRGLVFPLVAGLIVIGVYGSYVRPAIEGDWGVREVRGDAFDAQRNYLDAARYLKSVDPQVGEDWRVAWLPLSAHDALSLEWILPRWANEPVLESTDPHAQAMTDVITKSLSPFDPELFHLAADRAGVRYVVVVRNPDGGSPSAGSTEVAPEVTESLESDDHLRLVHSAPGFLIWRNLSASPIVRPFDTLFAVMASEGVPRVNSSPGPNLLDEGDYADSLQDWNLYPKNAFAITAGPGSSSPVIQVRGDRVDNWPVMSKRLPVLGGTSYELSARVRVQNATEAHVKIIWYAAADDHEEDALRHDYASPLLNGTQDWTKLSSGVIVAPAFARFAEVQFLAGRRRTTSAPAATSWMSELALEQRYVGRKPSSDPRRVLAALSLAGTLPVTSAIIDGSELAQLIEMDSTVASTPISAFLLNPTRSTIRQAQPLLTRAEETQALFEAPVALEPIAGIWRVDRGGDLVGLTAVTTPAVVQLPLSLPSDLRGSIKIMGCRLDGLGLSLISAESHRTLTLSPPGEDCEPVTIPELRLPARSMLRLSAREGVRLDGIHMVGRPHSRALPSPRDTASLANARTPGVSDASTYGGYVLSEAYSVGWQAQGVRAAKFYADFSFNGFVLADSTTAPQFDYKPQKVRNALLVISGLTWLATLGALAWFRIRYRSGVRRVSRLLLAAGTARTARSRKPTVEEP